MFDGEFVSCDVYDLEECLTSIRIRDEEKDKRIKYLEEENRKLKSETYKDKELQGMKEALDKMKKDYYRGFPITEEENKLISDWKKKHDKEKHGLDTNIKRMRAGGAIGGRYSYIFTPTSIGVVGEVQCDCGEKICFAELL